MIDKKTKNIIIKKVTIDSVASMFLHLTPRDSNFVGYCPFCNCPMPTFFVNTSNNTFSCSECDKSGSAIDFVIDMLGVNYDDALMFLSQLCGVTVNGEHQKSQAATLFEINEAAANYYQKQLRETAVGRDVALSYYKQVRGFSDETIERFRLGYSPDRAENKVIETLTAQGYSEDDIVAAGIGVKYENKPTYDRFYERITFPITNLAGKIVAFSCRTMRNDSDIAKYKNTNDTPIYTKGDEIYGLYQARESIIREGYCILVEGNADVVSMHQAGFTNTIAPLGTGFTFSQACVIRRFTDKVTLLFDGDNAGIHANEVALQHFLPLGIVPDIVLLPQGDDPDSFARKLSKDDAVKFLKDNSIGLVQFYFKTRLGGVTNNPIRTAQVTKEIIQKIALIPNGIVQSEMAKECHQLFRINETSVLQDIQRAMLQIREEQFKKAQQAQYREAMQAQQQAPIEPLPDAAEETAEADEATSSALLGQLTQTAKTAVSENVVNKERKIVQYMAKYGMVSFGATMDSRPLTLIEYIDNEFNANGLCISQPVYQKIFELGLALLGDFYNDLDEYLDQIEKSKKTQFDEGIELIMQNDYDINTIEKEEQRLKNRIERQAEMDIENFRKNYFETYLINHPDREVRTVSLDLTKEQFTLSKIHTQLTSVKTEFDSLEMLVQDAINNLRYEMISIEIANQEKILATTVDPQIITELMTTIAKLQEHRKLLATYLGERVVNPN